MPTKNSKLCSAHFKKEDFKTNSVQKVNLQEFAVPSIFPGKADYINGKYKSIHNYNLFPAFYKKKNKLVDKKGNDKVKLVVVPRLQIKDPCFQNRGTTMQ